MKDVLKTVFSFPGGVLPYMACTGMCPQGVLPGKSDGDSRRKFLRTPLKGIRNLFQYGRVPNSLPPLRGTNSTTTNYITGTANFNCNKDNFRTLSCQGLFESIVINLNPNQVIYDVTAGAWGKTF